MGWAGLVWFANLKIKYELDKRIPGPNTDKVSREGIHVGLYRPQRALKTFTYEDVSSLKSLQRPKDIKKSINKRLSQKFLLFYLIFLKPETVRCFSLFFHQKYHFSFPEIQDPKISALRKMTDQKISGWRPPILKSWNLPGK